MKIDTNKLEVAMARACMNTADLQKKAGIPRSTVDNAMSRNKGVRPATAGRIAKALGIDVVEIIEQ